MRDQLTPDEADLVMANIYPEHRRWCVASCGYPPGVEYFEFGCACTGCIHGDLSWNEWLAWNEREKRREPTPYLDSPRATDRPQPSLAERLKAFKQRKRS